MTADEDLPCVEVVELVTDYLEDALDPQTRASFELHLAACSGCTAYLEQVRLTAAAVGRVTPETLPEETVNGLLAAFRSLRPRRD